METERILFRTWRDDDAETLYRYASDPEVGPRAGWPPHKSVEESLEIIRTIFHSDHIWAIALKNAGGDDCVPTVAGGDACVPSGGEPIGCMERNGVPIRWIDGTLPIDKKAEIIVNALR